jgi:acyl carrier protein
MSPATTEEAETRLLDWVRANVGDRAVTVDRRTTLVGADGVLDSLALVSLTFMVEELLGRPVDLAGPDDLERFRSVESIVDGYFRGAGPVLA